MNVNETHKIEGKNSNDERFFGFGSAMGITKRKIA